MTNKQFLLLMPSNLLILRDVTKNIRLIIQKEMMSKMAGNVSHQFIRVISTIIPKVPKILLKYNGSKHIGFKKYLKNRY